MKQISFELDADYVLVSDVRIKNTLSQSKKQKAAWQEVIEPKS